MIYLDNAATTLPKPKCVIQAVTEAMQTWGNSSRSSHNNSLLATESIYNTRLKVSKFFNCGDPCRVIFTCNATESLNTAINGIFNPGDHVITTVWEHNSVLRPLYRLQKEQGIELSFIGTDGKGNLELSQLDGLFKDETRAIICTHASNVTGNVADLESIGRWAKSKGLLFVVDGSQTAGILPIDMERLGIDVLCCSGHKGLMGPQGTGLLCLNSEVVVRPLKVGGTGFASYSQEQPQQYPEHLEAGTLNGHGLAGLSASLDFINEIGLEEIYKHEYELAHYFYKKISCIKDIKVYGDWERKPHLATVALNLGEIDSALLADILAQDYQIAIRSGAHCAPLMHTSPQGAVRFSFSYFNTLDEIDRVIEAIEEIGQRRI